MYKKKYLFLCVLPTMILAMEKSEHPTKKDLIAKDFNDSAIEMDSVVIGTNDLDVEQKTPLFNDELSKNNFTEFSLQVLRNTPCFKEEEDEHINTWMTYLKERNPGKYGEIRQQLKSMHNDHNEYHIRKRKNLDLGSAAAINPKKLKNVNDKLLFALVETLRTGQEVGRVNRIQDLEIAHKDRLWARGMNIVNFAVGVPALVMAAYNLYHMFH